MSTAPWVRNAFTQISNSSECENFLAVGDAAAAFEPISSMGIGFAISSACQATSIVQLELIERNQKRIETYQQDIIQNFNNYLKIRKQFYQKEKRWYNSDFWNRRN